MCRKQAGNEAGAKQRVPIRRRRFRAISVNVLRLRMKNPRLNFSALAFSMAAHASLLFAWQVPVPPPVEEKVLGVVLLPPVQAQHENKPEPPQPVRTPQASQPVRTPALASPRKEMAAELSDQLADMPAAQEAPPSYRWPAHAARRRSCLPP